MTTPKTGMPEITQSQSNKYVTHNEALRYIDGNMHPVAVSKSVASCPASPVNGDVYIVPDSITASTYWSGHEGEAAHFYSSVWNFYTPFDGMTFRVMDESAQGVNHAYTSTNGWGAEVLHEAIVSVVASAGAPSVNLDLSLGNVFDLLLAANASVQFINAATGDGVATRATVRIHQDGTGSRTISYINGMEWAGSSATAPTAAASAVDINSYITFNSSTFVAKVESQNIG